MEKKLVKEQKRVFIVVHLFHKKQEKLANDLKDIKDNKREKQNQKGKEVLTKGYNGTKKIVTTVVNIIRYLIGLLLLIGSVVCIGDWFFCFFYLLMGISLMPLIYNIIWKNKDVKSITKILVQVIVSMIVLIIFVILD